MIPRRPRTKSVMCMSANTLPMVAPLSRQRLDALLDQVMTACVIRSG